MFAKVIDYLRYYDSPANEDTKITDLPAGPVRKILANLTPDEVFRATIALPAWRSALDIGASQHRELATRSYAFFNPNQRSLTQEAINPAMGYRARFSRSGRYVAYAGTDDRKYPSVVFYEVKTGRAKVARFPDQWAVPELFAGPNDTFFMTGDSPGAIREVDISGRVLRAARDGVDADGGWNPHRLSFSDSGRYMLSLAKNRAPKLWDLSIANSLTMSHRFDRDAVSCHFVSSHDAVEVESKNNSLTTYLANASGSAKQLSAEESARLCVDNEVNKKQWPLMLAAISPDGMFGLGISSDKKRVEGWWLGGKKPLSRRFNVDGRSVTQIEFSADGSHVLIVAPYKSPHVWQLDDASSRPKENWLSRLFGPMWPN